MTSDDGYILTIARAREDVGYVSNYYRWFAVPEAPSAGSTSCTAVGADLHATPWCGCPPC